MKDLNDRPAVFHYRILSASVVGAAHTRLNLPNQDAWAQRPLEGAAMPLCFAVADGHGSASSFRSDVGSRMAVETAVDVMRRFLESHHDSPLPLIKRTAEERLPREVHRLWLERVREHSAQQPYTDAELQHVEKVGGPRAVQKVHDNPLIVYGSTLLAVGVMPSHVLFLQLGDGDILVVDNSGDVIRPLPADARVFADETTSLCLPDAWREFRSAFCVVSENSPALITVSTDGYANCFASEQDFLKTGSGWLELLRTRGIDDVGTALESHLHEISRKYSGDDITLGMVWFLPADNEPAAA